MDIGGTVLSDEIKRYGYWRVVIRPQRFEEARIAEMSELLPILMRCKLSVLGWDFPHISNTSRDIQRGTDFIGQDFRWNAISEVMRFYQSGLFYHLSSIHLETALVKWEDYVNFEKIHTVPIFIIGAIFHFIEIFELAARLSVTKAGDENMLIEVTLGNIKDRSLSYGNWPNMIMPGEYKSTISDYPQIVTIPRGELLDNPRALAAKMTKELFSRFNWDISVKLITDLQSNYH